MRTLRRLQEGSVAACSCSGRFNSSLRPLLSSQRRRVWARAHDQAKPAVDGTDDSSNGSTSSSTPSSSKPAEEEVDALLTPIWDGLKRELPAEQATLLERFTVEDLMDGNKVLRSLAEDLLGPTLAELDIDEDPLTFFIDLFKLATCVHLLSCGMMFYGTELGLHYDAGEALRATSGLLLGYVSRIFIKVEHLAWPVYNSLLQLLAGGDVNYTLGPASEAEMQNTLNTLAGVTATTFFVAQLGFGLTPSESLQLVLPLGLGLFSFDLAYLVALLLKLRLL